MVAPSQIRYHASNRQQPRYSRVSERPQLGSRSWARTRRGL